jgi:NADPH:quinone reductase-like Zn-dependent oxidoreductase
VTAVGLNPMDWDISSQPETAARYGIAVPSGFGSDFAGVVDEVGDDTTGFVGLFAVGDRAYGGALGRAAADFVVVKASYALFHTPDGISDEVASTLPVAGSTAVAALGMIGLRPGDTVLIGGAAGGVGGFGVQPAGAIDGEPDILRWITDAILADKVTVPIAAGFPIEQIRDAVTLQAGRQVHGKVVVTL